MKDEKLLNIEVNKKDINALLFFLANNENPNIKAPSSLDYENLYESIPGRGGRRIY